MSLLANALVFFAASICVASATDKTPCCFSKQFIANITIVAGTVKNGSTIPEFIQNSFIYVYDKDKKRERVNGIYSTGYGPSKSATPYQAWNDYTTGKRYELTGSNCTVTPLSQTENQQVENCVPDTLKWQATYVLGSGKEAVNVSSWEGMFQNFRYTFVTTEKGCTPVSITRFGEDSNGSSLVENTQISGFIPNRFNGESNVLDIPQTCFMN